MLLIAAQVNGNLLIEKIESENGFTEVNIGYVNMVKSYDTIVHIVNPQEIERIVDNLEFIIRNSDLGDKVATLNHQITNIRNKIKTLIPHRQKRGLINLVGTINKWLWGTMDDNDTIDIEENFKVVDTNNHNIIENLNS